MSVISGQKAEPFSPLQNVQIESFLSLLHRFGKSDGHSRGHGMSWQPCATLAGNERGDGGGSNPGPGDARLEVVEKCNVVPEKTN